MRRVTVRIRRRVIVGTRRCVTVDTRRPVIHLWYPNTSKYCIRRRVSVGNFTFKRVIFGNRRRVIVGTGDRTVEV